MEKVTTATSRTISFHLPRCPFYEEVYDQYFDTAGNYHFFGTYSGEHIIRPEDIQTEDLLNGQPDEICGI